MQDERFTHADLHRRACRAHERKLRAPSSRGPSGLAGGELAAGGIDALGAR